MRAEGRGERVLPGGLFIHVLQKVCHADIAGRFAFVKIALYHFSGNGEGRLRRVRRRGKRLVGGAVFCALINDGVIFVLDRHRAQDMAAFARKIHFGNGGAHPDEDIVCGDNPLLYAVCKNHMEVRPFFRQRGQRRAVPLGGVAAVHQLYLRVKGEIPVEPLQRLRHAGAVGACELRKVFPCHFRELGHLFVAHGAIAERRDVQKQLFLRVQPKLAAKRLFCFEIAFEFRAQKIHHHGARHRGALARHAVRHQALARFFAPACLHTLFCVAVEIEPGRGLLRVG